VSKLDDIAHSTELALTSKAATAGGSVSAVIFGVSADVVGVIAGIMIGGTGLAYQIWAGERRHRALKKKAEDDDDV